MLQSGWTTPICWTLQHESTWLLCCERCSVPGRNILASRSSNSLSAAVQHRRSIWDCRFPLLSWRIQSQRLVLQPCRVVGQLALQYGSVSYSAITACVRAQLVAALYARPREVINLLDEAAVQAQGVSSCVQTTGSW